MINFAEIQGNILRGYSFSQARFLFLSFQHRSVISNWLAGVVDQITNGEDWGDNPPSSTFNVALSYPGLELLGVPQETLDSFPEAFREGMLRRADRLRDTGVNAPVHWDDGLGTPDVFNSIHAMISVYANTETEIDTRLDHVLPTGTTGVSELYNQPAELLPEGREHFGYRDGISQPAVEGVDPPRNAGGGLHIPHQTSATSMAPGEFVLGYSGQGGIQHATPAAPFDKNSTYLVYRKLHQDVATFRSYLEETAERLRLDSTWLGARIVGRWKDGTPIILSPDAPDRAISGDPNRVNNFRFGDDPAGLGCPIGAHIRRCNPRDGLPGGVAGVEGHRMIRRGIPYGEPLPKGTPDDGTDRGLLFIACNVNLREQFEFVQRLWMNDSGFTGTLDPTQKDTLAGNNGGTGTMRLPMPGFPRQLQGIPNFVALRFGIYLFAPSVGALRSLAASPS